MTGRSLPDLSLEDALELHAFARAKVEHGARMFVTADRGILVKGHGVHPRDVVRSYELGERT